MDSLRGQLLIAGPALDDPNFHRTVVLICAHGDEGALGLVLNRPSPLAVGDAVPELSAALDEGGRLWVGGPVQPASVVLLADFVDPGESLVVAGDLGLVTDGSSLDDLVDRTRRVRAFIGHSGWGPGQLEAEVERDDWIVAPLRAADPFDHDAESMWSRALQAMGGRYALVARMPEDPSVN
ncbi:MAG TPA: YqgE/AlgH family protein [Capillimicrobium sp.]|nr:YqgE/AlgH family protein [Capillimicrobium sp.]